MYKLLLFATLAAATISPVVHAQIETNSSRCQTAQKIVTQNHLSTRNLTGKMFCEVTEEKKEYVVLGMRYNRSTEEEGPGSNLIGWYALRLKDNRLFEWDITQEKFVGSGFRATAK